MKNKTILTILGAALLPFIVLSVMLLAAEPFYSQHGSNEHSGLSWAGFFFGFFIGVFCILALPIKVLFRILLLLVYCPVVVALMVAWAFMFTGLAFDRWL